MVAWCPDGSASIPDPVRANVVYFGAGAIASYLNNKGMGWAYGVAPALGVLAWNLSDFCTAAPPALPTITASDVFNWFNPLNGQATVQLRTAMTDLIQAYVWFDLCKCATGAQPSPPAPLAAPSGFEANPPSVTGAYPSATPCASADTLPVAMLSSPVTEALWITGAGQLAAGVTSLSVQAISAGNLVAITVQVFFFNAGGAPIGNQLAGVIGAGGLGFTSTVNVPVGTTAVTVQFSWSGSVGSGIHSRVFAAAYCNGAAPNAPLVPCCPPDPVQSAMVQQILDMVTLLQRQLAPFAYIQGTVHSSLSGSGVINVQGLLGAKITVHSPLPTRVGESAGEIVDLWDVGWINWGTDDFYTAREWIQNTPQLSRPCNVSEFTHIAYSLNPGIVIDIQEIQRER